MSNSITEDEVRQVAKLARLNCSEEEISMFTGQLSAILEHVESLNELNTDDVEPLAHCQPVHNVFREDEVRPSLTNEQAMANAPQKDGEHFAVPKVLGDGSA